MKTDCNRLAAEDAAEITGESLQNVKMIAAFAGKYIASTIKEGAFETVMIPYFGKFQPKTKEIQWSAQYKGMPRPIKLENNEGTIQDNGES